MRVDFYQLSRDPAESAVALIAGKVVEGGGRLLVVSADPDQRRRIAETLWSAAPTSFLANGEAADGHSERQPILLSDATDPINTAQFLLIADGRWREGDTPFARTFFLFDEATVQHARETWKALREREGLEQFYWKQEGGRWIQAG